MRDGMLQDQMTDAFVVEGIQSKEISPGLISNIAELNRNLRGIPNLGTALLLLQIKQAPLSVVGWRLGFRPEHIWLECGKFDNDDPDSAIKEVGVHVGPLKKDRDMVVIVEYPKNPKSKKDQKMTTYQAVSIGELVGLDESRKNQLIAMATKDDKDDSIKVYLALDPESNMPNLDMSDQKTLEERVLTERAYHSLAVPGLLISKMAKQMGLSTKA